MNIRFFGGLTRWRNYFWFLPNVSGALFMDGDTQIIIGFMCFSAHINFGPKIGKKLKDQGIYVKLVYEVKQV